MSTSWCIPKLGETIIVEGTLICTDNQNNWKTRRNSKKWSRGWNITSLILKSMKLPTRSVVYRSLWIGSRRENSLQLRPFNIIVVLVLNLKIFRKYFISFSIWLKTIKLIPVKIIDSGLHFFFFLFTLFFFYFSFLFFSIFRTTWVRVYQSCCHISHKLMAKSQDWLRDLGE